jgi:hypothetical protein
MKEEKKNLGEIENPKFEELKDEKQEEPKQRQIVLETDGNTIKIVKAEVAGNIELIAILLNVIEALKKQ